MVGAVGFAPTKASGRQIYSLVRLTAPPRAHCRQNCGLSRCFKILEPTPRVELGTFALQKRCSAIELGRQNFIKHRGLSIF